MNDCFKEFTRHVKDSFGNQYLNRSPTEDEVKRCLHINAARGFPGMFASWDCKHFLWAACPKYLAGQAQGSKGASLILEAICDGELYIWHFFFGEPGSLNDLNVLDKSRIVADILSGKFNLKTAWYQINNTVRDFLYFLVNGIYPDWAIFIDTFADPHQEKQKYYADKQEGVRKDIERCFGGLVQQFQILKHPLRMWYWDEIVDLLECCIIIHNMIVEHRRPGYMIGRHMYAPVDIYREDGAPERISLFRSCNSVGTDNQEILQPREDVATAIAARREQMLANLASNYTVRDFLYLDLVNGIYPDWAILIEHIC